MLLLTGVSLTIRRTIILQKYHLRSTAKRFYHLDSIFYEPYYPSFPSRIFKKTTFYVLVALPLSYGASQALLLRLRRSLKRNLHTLDRRHDVVVVVGSTIALQLHAPPPHPQDVREHEAHEPVAKVLYTDETLGGEIAKNVKVGR